ncbi:MAG TPA: BON domain-containing protein [Thermoanaerobaculia bacterium]|nr:BON domain-containing protein [Thermoanaerobaculia bacterium]
MRTTKSTLIGAAILAALVAFPGISKANDTATVDITPQLRRSGLDIDNLRGIEIGGIVILRGKSVDAASALRAGEYVQQLGYTRVANLIEVVTPPDDAHIRRTAERELAMQRSLEGCNISVESQRGIVTIAGKVNSPLQRDVAMDIVRNIDGVRAVKSDFSE